MKKLTTAVFVVVALAAVAFLGGTPEPGPPGEPAAAAAPADLARTFHFDYRADTSVELRGAQDSETFRGALDLAGELVVSPVSRAAGEPRRLEVSVGRLDRHNFSFLGQQVLDDSSDPVEFFVDVSLVVHVDDRGFMIAVEEPDNPDPAHHILEVLATDLPVGFEPPESPGTFSQDTTRGILSGVASLSSDGRVLTHRAVEYSDIPGVPAEAMKAVKVEGHTVVHFDPEDAVSKARGSEVITAPGYASNVLWKLDTIDSRTASSLAVPMRETRRPGRAVVRRDTAQQHLVQRVGSMTPQALRDSLISFASGGVMPDHNRWLWQASGLLIQEPSLAHSIAALIADPRLNTAARHTIVDLLVAAGHPEAQAALRDALREGLPRFTPAESVSLVHRTTRLKRPEPEIIAFVEERFASEDVVVSRATAYTLGALASGVTGEARERLLGKISGMLTEDAPSAQIKSALAGLGNAGTVDSVGLIAAYVDHDDAELRGQAAIALRKINTDGARELLIGLLDDSAVWVQRDALSALMHQGASPEMAKAVARRVTAGTLTEPNYAEVVNLLKAAESRSEEVLEALAHMSTVPLKRAALRQRIMDLHAKFGMTM